MEPARQIGEPIGIESLLDDVQPDWRQIDLSGTWSGNDGGRYFRKQIDSCVWWSGLSDFEGQGLGDEWIMTFRGTLNAEGVILGDFVDVKGTNPGASIAAIEGVADKVEATLQDRPEREMGTEEVGAIVMEELKRLDKVAYVRFASVYRSFRDVGEFMSELKDLLSAKE